MFFLKKRKKKIFLVLDIGSEAIKSLFFSISGLKKTIMVLGAGLQYFKNPDIFIFNAEEAKKTILKAIEKARRDVLFSLSGKELKKRVQKQKKCPVLIGLPPSILRGKITSCYFLREEPQEKISAKEEKFIYHRLVASVKKKISQEFAESFGILPKDIYWLSLKVFEAKLDGYPTSRLKGLQGKNLEFKVFAVFLPVQWQKNIKEIFDSLNLKIFRTVHLAEVLPLIFGTQRKNGFFLDIGGEVTQIFAVKNSELKEIEQFKKGGKIFSQELSQSLGLNEKEARIIKEKYSEKKLTIGTRKKIKQIFSEKGKEWRKNLKAKLKEINSREVFFPNIFLLGGSGSLPEIRRALEEENFSGGFFRSRKIELIGLKNLKDIEIKTKNLKEFQHIPSLLISCRVLF